jgi:hypothetical protein
MSLSAAASSKEYLADTTCFTATAVGSFHLSSSRTYHRLMGPVRRASFSKLVRVFGVPFHGGAAKTLGDVDFDFFFAAKCDGVLDALDEVVDVPDVGVGTYLDDVSFAFSLLQSRTEGADFFGRELGACAGSGIGGSGSGVGGGGAGWAWLSLWAL